MNHNDHSDIIVNPYNKKDIRFRPQSRNNFYMDQLNRMDYKCLNDAVMVPDKGFTKQLKMLDPDYEVVWDWGSSKWEIWKFPKDLSEPYHIMTIETKDKSYRELGADILLKMQESIWFRDNFTGDQLADYFEEMERQAQRRKMKAFRDRIDSVARDTFNWAQGILQVQVPKSSTVIKHINDNKGI